MREFLWEGLPQIGISTDAIPPLTKFSQLLLERNQVMNLTAITDPREVATLHLLDSLCLVPLLEGASVVDVGTGGGFPGMPLAIACPSIRFTLLDSLHKRIRFLSEAAAALGLTNVICVHGRAEEFGHREEFDTAVSRAVAGLPILCELCLPLVKVGGCFLAMKSSHSAGEITAAEAAVKLLGGKIESVTDYTIPTTDVTHRVVCIRKVSPTPKKYPRRFAQIKKQPLGTQTVS